MNKSPKKTKRGAKPTGKSPRSAPGGKLETNRRQFPDQLLRAAMDVKGFSTIIFRFLHPSEWPKVRKLVFSHSEALWKAMRPQIQGNLAHVFKVKKDRLSALTKTPQGLSSVKARSEHTGPHMGAISWMMGRMNVPPVLWELTSSHNVKALVESFDEKLWLKLQPRVEKGIRKEFGLTPDSCRRYAERPDELWRIEERQRELKLRHDVGAGHL